MSTRKAFTLVELLVVIAIIAILVAMMLPAIQAARESGRRVTCKNNLHQIGVALHLFHDARASLPAGWNANDPATRAPDPNGQPGWGWGVMIFPFMEETATYKNRVHLKNVITDPTNAEARVTVIPTFLCPSDPAPETFDLLASDGVTPLVKLATAHYIGMFGTSELEDCEGAGPGNQCTGDGVLYHNSHTAFRDIRDGLSRTIAVGERFSQFGYSTWTGMVPGAEEALVRVVSHAEMPPNSPDADFHSYGSHHGGGTHFVFADGSVHLIADEVEFSVFQALSTRASADSTGNYQPD